MTFSVNVSGHTDSPDDEKTLAGSLGQVLANAGPAVTFASFNGSGFTGDPRDLATAPTTT